MVTAISVTIISIIFFITTVLWYKSSQSHIIEIEEMLDLHEQMLNTLGNGILVTNEANEIIYMNAGIKTLLEAIELPLSLGDAIQVLATRVNRHIVGDEEITLKDLSLEPSVLTKERVITVSDFNKSNGSYLILVKAMTDSNGARYQVIQTRDVTKEVRNKTMNEHLLEFSRSVYKAQNLEELVQYVGHSFESIFKSDDAFITLFGEDEDDSTTYFSNKSQRIPEKNEDCLRTHLLGHDKKMIGILGVNMEEGIVDHDLWVKGLELMAAYLTQVIEKIIIDTKMKALTYYDPLTQLPNRHKFLSSLEQEIVNTSLKNNQVLGVCFLDLKGFKRINDINGHEVGDYVLTVLSQRMLSRRNFKYEIGRLGGDEFGIYIACDQEECVEKLCGEIIALMQQPVYKEDMVFTVSCNIGVSYYKKHGITPLELLKKADEALSIAKTNGDNNYHINEENIR